MQPSLRVKRSEGEREAHVINGVLQAASAAPLNDDVADLAPRFDARRVEWRGLPRFPGQQQVARLDPTALRQEIERPRLSAAGGDAVALLQVALLHALCTFVIAFPPAGRRRREPPWRDRRRWARFAVARARLMAKPHLSGRAPKLGLTSGSSPLPLGGFPSIQRIFAGPGTVAEIGATRYLFGPSNRLPRMMRRDDEPSKEESGKRKPWSSLMGRAQTGDRDAYRRLLIEITPSCATTPDLRR